MRTAENRLNVRCLYVLGAGASFSASSHARSEARQAPLDKDFCRRILELDVQRPHWVGVARTRLLRSWKDHTPLPELGLEYAILRQLGHLDFIQAIHPARKRGTLPATDFLNDVAHLACFVLNRARESSSQPYARFVKNVFPRTMAAERLRDRIITFNYDSLLDSHIVARFGAERTYFDRILRERITSTEKKKRKRKRKRTIRFAHPFMVKLHGSINWRCSTDEFSSLIADLPEGDNPHHIPNVWWQDGRMPSPDDDVSPVLIPPLPVKPITSIKLFNFLWTKAFEYLHEAEELVVCGYSLPDADRLAMSLFGGFKNASLRKITVVDPDAGVVSRWRDLVNRNGVSRPVWQYHADFAEYVDSMEHSQQRGTRR